MTANGTPSSLLSEAFGEDLESPLPNLHELFDTAARKHPNNTALVARHQPADLYAFVHDDPSLATLPHLRWTFRSVQKAAHVLARSLQCHGIVKGMSITTVVQNGVEWFLIVYASALLGCPVAPLNARTLINADEAIHVLKIADAKVVVAGDLKLASSINKLVGDAGLDVRLRILVNSDEMPRGWLKFAELLDSRPLDLERFTFSPPEHFDSDICIIAFTSGTTSLPKGCPLPNIALKHVLAAINFQSLYHEHCVCCIVWPNNHLVPLFHLWSFISVGGCIVYPGPAFDVSSVLTSFQEDHTTDFSCVPTMLHALLDRMDGGKYKFTHLQRVSVGGAAVSAHNLRQVIHSLGAKSVGTSYGMTEGVVARGGPTSNPEDLIRGDAVISGKPFSGIGVRICDPETGCIVPRGVAGELHQCGPQLIEGYIGLGPTKDFYRDENGRKWLRSGDQGVMFDDGSISIVGRYKDMIIRGGENISPAAIEAVLNQLIGVDAHVVGLKDDIAGEVPVAVYRTTEVVPIEAMQKHVLNKLGPMYLPSQFLSIENLGLQDLPKTISGKVQKTKLAAVVREYLQKLTLVNGYHEPVKDRVLQIWSNLLGLPAHKIDIHSSVDDFADSITIMRFRDQVRKELGKTITLEDMIANESVAAQISLLENQAVSSTANRPTFASKRPGPPTADDMIHVAGDEALMAETKIMVEKAVNPHGFTWDDDVEDVMPTYDYLTVQFTQQRANSHNRRHAVATKRDVNTLHTALVAALSKHSTLRSFFVRRNEMAFFVTMRPNERWFEQAVTQNGSLSTVEELGRFASESTLLDHSFPGPLFRAMIFHIEETGCAGFVWNGNHVTFDALSAGLFIEDVKKTLSSPKTAPAEHVPYKFWADTYYTLRDSATARQAVKWHAQRLASLSNHRQALFPPQRAPRWFLGPARGWEPTEVDAKKGYPNLHRSNLSLQSSYERNGFTWRGELPLLKRIRDAVPGLTNPVIAKAAMALMNVHYTKHTHALFTTLEAGRSHLPFVPAHLAAQLEHINCADVAGPTFEFVVDLVRVDPDETLHAFLARLQDEQRNITKYAHAPITDIVATLGTGAHGTGSGDVMLEVFRRQLFNWAPGAGRTEIDTEAELRQVLGHSQSDNGIVFMAGAGGEGGTTFTLNARWDDANTTREEAQEMVGVMARMLEWVTEGSDAGWEQRLVGAGLKSACLP